MADHNQQGQQQQQQQQQQGTPQQQPHPSPHPDLNFSIQAILDDNSGNNVPFPIVQNIGHNPDGSQHAYARLPAELQHLFATNGADDLSGTDPNVIHQHVQEILWNNNNNNNNKDSKSNNNTNNNSNVNTATSSPIVTTTPQQQHQQAQWVLPMSTPMSLPPHTMPQHIQPQPPPHQQHQQASPQQHIMAHPPAPIPHQQAHPHSVQTPQTQPSPVQQQQQPPQPSPQQQHPTPPPPGNKATTLLENIISQLSPERKEEFMVLFRKLQTNSVSPEQFYIQAKSMLGQQEYQQLEDLKNKPSSQDKDNDKKRAAGPSNSQGQPMTGIVTPQLKRAKTENNNNNIPAGMPMGPPMSGPMNPAFKAHAQMPNIPGLQVPPTSRPTALPGQSTPAKSNTSTPAPGQANAGDRIDYDTLTDVMGYAGVDLKEEEQHFMKDGEAVGGVLPDGIDRSKTQEFMNPELLKERVLEIAKPFGLEKLDGDFVSLLALATQERLRSLVEQMVVASKHRTLSQHVSAPPPLDENGQPLYKIVIQQDTKKQLLAIERAEREEEQKRKEAIAERERRSQLGKEGQGEEGRSKSKKKDKDGSQQRSGLGDGLGKSGGSGVGGETALMKAIGGVRKSWMLTGNARDQSSSGAPANLSSGQSQQESSQSSSQEGATASSAPGTPAGTTGGMGRGAEGDDSPRGRGRPRGRKEGKRSRGRGRDVGLFLPPSTIGRRFGDAATRKITVRDALFALERDCQAGGQGGGQRTLLKTYNQWLK